MRMLYFTLLCLIFHTKAGLAQPLGYNFGKQIEIASSLVSGNSNLIDFPLFINITDPNLRSTANGGHIENVNGFDMLFTLMDCETLLSFQIESYNPVNGNVIAWVRVPVLSASVNTQFFMYYGNSNVSSDPSSPSTWNANFEGVWHMNDDPSTSLLNDYSGNGVNGTSFGSMTSSDLVDGKLGHGIDFDGSDDYFALAAKSFTIQGEIQEISISAWINTTHASVTQNSNWAILDFDRSEYFNFYIHGDGRLAFSTLGGGGGNISDSYAGNATDLNDGTWHYVVGVFNGNDKLLYIDGVLSLTDPNVHTQASIGSGTSRFGFIGDGSEASTFNGIRNYMYYDGMYDEIRMLNSSLSTDWIATEYNNQNDPSSFHTASAELSASQLCLTLPIELGMFNASLTRNQTVVLEWNTLSEVNNDYFEVLRGENDFDWEVIDVVDGAGNSTQETHYSSVDYSPERGTNYYRIRQVDFNGDYTYSPIRAISTTDSPGIYIYPNPTNDLIVIEGSVDELNASLMIRNELGQNMTNRIVPVRISENKIQIDLSNLSNGLYLITVGNSKKKVIKI